jgi:hypothetical protein
VTLIGAEIVVPQIFDGQRVAIGGEKRDQLPELGLICADRVRAAVRFELKPAEIFGGGGLEVEWHCRGRQHVATLGER